MYHIYALTDPRDDQVRYVGMSKNVWRRYAMHLLVPSKMTPAKNAWVRELKEANLSPLLTILEAQETEENASQRETYWIQHYLMQNVSLLNIVKTGKKRPSGMREPEGGWEGVEQRYLALLEEQQEKK